MNSSTEMNRLAVVIVDIEEIFDVDSDHLLSDSAIFLTLSETIIRKESHLALVGGTT